MDLQLAGKKVAITGASRGIGAAAARAFAREGAQLTLIARDVSALEELGRELRGDLGATVTLAAADLRDAAALKSLAAELGAIDILVNNAGDIPGGALDQVSEERWRHAWELKVFGYINLTREVYAAMRERGGGVILNNIGTAGEGPFFHYIAGASGNAALMNFTRSLGSMSLFDNIRVLAVNPGSVGTERSRQLKRLEAKRLWGDENRYAELYAELPLGRPASPEEVADLIVFLASPRAGYVSGSIHTIDGGGGKRPPGRA
ncbi:MAG: short-chain dehydrogenase/reductase [Ramlibacter sp.]|nr:short-chain dehydrogenase/reductase [Ramlibacter sp.]